jgi:integrase
MALSGVPPRIAMSIMGHTNIATTLEIYAAVGQDDAEAALSKAWRATHN